MPALRYYPKSDKPRPPLLCYDCKHKTYGERSHPSHYIECDAGKELKIFSAKRKCDKFERVDTK